MIKLLYWIMFRVDNKIRCHIWPVSRCYAWCSIIGPLFLRQLSEMEILFIVKILFSFFISKTGYTVRCNSFHQKQIDALPYLKPSKMILALHFLEMFIQNMSENLKNQKKSLTFLSPYLFWIRQYWTHWICMAIQSVWSYKFCNRFLAWDPGFSILVCLPFIGLATTTRKWSTILFHCPILSIKAFWKLYLRLLHSQVSISSKAICS